MAALSISLFVAGVIIVAHLVHHGGEVTPLSILNISAEQADPALIPKGCGKQLNQEDRKGFLRAWQSTRARFDYDPKTAIVYADLLISDLLGSPLSSKKRSTKHDFNNRIVNDRYQAAHSIAKSGNVRIMSVAELEHAMELYSALFEDVLLDINSEGYDIR